MSNTPDVRVRLSAEGVAEVVKSFKSVQEAAAKSKKEVGGVSDIAAKAKNILIGLGAVKAVNMFVNLAKRSMDLADGLGKLTQKTGNSVEMLSTLSFGARTADVAQESLNSSLMKFARAMDEYDQGVKETRDAVKGLFGDSKALVGLNQDERFLKIAAALGKLEPSAKRTGTAMALFGRVGAELLPLIDDLADGGFEKLREKAEAMGLVIDTDLAQATQRANDALTDLNSITEGATMQFTTGFAPALADVTEAMVEGLTGQGVEGFRTLGEYAGKILKGIVVAVMAVVGGIQKAIHGITISAIAQWRLVDDLLHGRWKGAWDRYQETVRTGMESFNRELEERYKKMFIALDGGAPKKDKPKRNQEVSEDLEAQRAAEKAAKERERLAEKQRKADMELAAARLDYDAKIAGAEAKAEEAAAKERFEQGLTSLRDYYAERTRIAEKQGQAEARALYDKVVELQSAQLGKDELQAERDAKIVKASADYQVKILENEAELKALRTEEAKETKELQEQSLDFEKRIREAQMGRFAAARAEIDAQAAALDEILKKQGVSAGDRAQRVGEYRDAGYQPIDFEEQASTASAALEQIDSRRREIARQVAAGQLFTFQAEQQIMQLEAERLPILRQIAAAMRAAAITPEQVQAAEDFQEQIEELALSSNKAALEMGQFKQDVEGALTSNLTTWLSSSINQAESLGDAFRSLALSIVQSLQQIAAQMLANLMIQKMLGFIAGAAGGAATGGGGAGSGPVSVASGGLIRGPGTATSDSIPARLSNFEYVVRAAVVKKPGMLELLNTMNYGTPAIRRRAGVRFAEGGLVDAQAGGGSAMSAGLTATLGLDEGLLLKKLEASPQFHRIFVRMAQSNKKAMRQALGG
jgi:hypothetical protein